MNGAGTDVYPGAPIAPVIERHDGIAVVRDDLYPGGTKARFIGRLFDGCEEAVYATPAEGGAQTALAVAARALGKRATLFVAARKRPHARTLEAARLGARVVPVEPGYLAVVQARAREYARAASARLIPFGADTPEAVLIIAAAARLVPFEPEEVWCAAGSGVLARALAVAFPRAERHAVRIGRDLTAEEVAGARIWRYPAPFGATAKEAAPFPADPHYDAKAWEICRANHGRGRRVLFWNVAPLPRP